MNTFGNRLKESLKEKRIKSIELAEVAGVSKSAISFYINDKSFPNQDFFRALKKLIPELNLNWLLIGDGMMLESGEHPKELSALQKELKESKARERELTDALVNMSRLVGKTPLAKSKGVYAPANLFLHENRLWFDAKHTVNYTPRFAH